MLEEIERSVESAAIAELLVRMLVIFVVPTKY
jgi:hypothetical protein